MSKIYTKKGDDGSTGLLGPGRVRKDHLRVEAYGEVDELSSALGVVLAEGLDEDLAATCRRIQYELFTVGAQLATLPGHQSPKLPRVQEAWATALEKEIDRLDMELEPLTHFIMPGGARAGAWLHFARTISRRAERRVVALASSSEVAREIIVYLNRLSDLLFTMARAHNHRRKVPETPWVPPAQ